MDFSLLPTPASEHNKQRTGARFTVRSANSPSYSLTRRPGVRKTRSLLEEEERESTEEFRDPERHGAHTGTNGTSKDEDHTIIGYQARTWRNGSVKGHREERETSDHKMSTQLNQTDSAGRTITEFATDRMADCNPASESRGRTDSRMYNMQNRSKSLDWRKGERSPERRRRTDMFVLTNARGEDEKRAGAEGVRGRVMSSVQVYNSAGAGTEVAPLSLLSQTIDRTSRGNSLPSRLRSQSGPGPGVRGTASSFGAQGGQSILERIEKLYGSAGLGKTEDCSKTRDLSTDVLTSPRRRSAGGTLPRCFSPGEQLCKSNTWMQKDTLGSETPGTRERLSGGQCQAQSQGRYSEERTAHWRMGLEDIGTRSLDRARSRHTAAAQIRSARAAGGITVPPQSNASLEEERFSFSYGLRERRASESKDQGRVNFAEEKGETDRKNRTLRERWFKGQEQEKETDDRAKEKTERKSSCTDEDVFESNPQKIAVKTIERKKFPEMTSKSIHSAASVKNKINQFEALTQRSQGLATGQALMPRRAFSVPTQLSRAYEGVKKSGSAKAIGGVRDRWEGLKEGVEASEKTEEKTTGRSERSLSVDDVGLRLAGKERSGNDLDENEGKKSDRSPAEALDKYSRLKSTLEIPLNGGAQRRQRNFYIDETDFAKASSPEDVSKKLSPSLLSSDTSAPPPKTSNVTCLVDDEDKTPTNTPDHSPFLSPATQKEFSLPTADSQNESISDVKQEAETPEQHSPSPPHPLSHSNLPDLISPDISAVCPRRTKKVLDLDAWVAGLNTKIKVWNEDEHDSEDDDESTQKDEDSNYDSDSGESSVTITSNMSQSDRRSFCVSLSDLCNFAGVDNESENDSDEWQSTGRRTASLSSDMSALSCVSVLPSEELDRLLEDVRNLGDNKLKDYDDVQVVVLHKEVGVGLGFSVAGGVDQNKPFTVHKVFPSGVAAQEGSIREGDQVLSINGTALSGYVHWEALRVLRRAKARELGVVVLRRGAIGNVAKGGERTKNPGPAQTQSTETGQCVCVRLEKNSRDLGFTLEGGVDSGLENKPLTVQKIFQGGPVDKVCPGDEVLEIDGVSMVGMRRLEAWTLIRKLPPGPVDVVLRRPLKHPET